MSESEIVFILYRPHDTEGSQWKQFWEYDCPGVTYKMIKNPMGRAPPDDKTHFAISNLNQPLKEDQDSHAKFDIDFADTEIRIYKLLQSYDPLTLGAPSRENTVKHDRHEQLSVTTSSIDISSPLLLQAEAAPADIKEFQRFYQVDHAVMMAKHPGYHRTLLYELYSVLKPAEPVKDVAPILILHEFETFEEVGGPITQASIVTPLAQKVFGAVRSMMSRGLELDNVSSRR